MPVTSSSITKLRVQLRRNGYDPIPVIAHTKKPPIKKWDTKIGTNDEEIEIWGKVFPDAVSTGSLCQYMPTLDIDILSPEASEAVEALVRARFEDECMLVRIGQPPKRAILFRTMVPFDKISVTLIAPNADPVTPKEEKLEFLATGQQVVVDGIHPATEQPYRWFGGSPLDTKRSELPLIKEVDARKLICDAVELLTSKEYGYKIARHHPKRRPATVTTPAQAVSMTFKPHKENSCRQRLPQQPAQAGGEVRPVRHGRRRGGQLSTRVNGSGARRA